jgi:hypothetical protein
VHASPQFLSQGPQLGLPPLAHRLPQNREMSLPRLPTTVRGKGQEQKKKMQEKYRELVRLARQVRN